MSGKDIYIIGSGAIGKALAVFLKKKNKSVQIIRGSVDNLTSEENLIEVIGTNGSVEETITTTTFSNLSSINGVVLIATKAFANDQIAKKLGHLKGNFSIVLLQNGLNIERPFEGFSKVYRCVLLSTSQVTGEHQVTFKSVAASPIGNLEGKNKGLKEVIDQISSPQFEFREESNIVKYVWNKVIANCVFNTICPLLETDNGIFYRNIDARNMAEEVVGECVSLAKAISLYLDYDEIMQNLLLISRKSDGQLISTYMDILNNRPTEIQSLNMEIAKIAEELGQPELVKKTRILGQMVQLKSNISNLKDL